MNRILWGYYYKSREKAEKQFKQDLIFCKGVGVILDQRHPEVIERIFKNNKVRYGVFVDDIIEVTDMEMTPEIKKEWDNFRKFISERHNLMTDWIPDYQSIKLWVEYQQYEKDSKTK